MSADVNSEGNAIFSGLNVLELGAGAAGPVATSCFAEFGASVIRIESPSRPDFLRLLHVTRDNQNDSDILDRAPMFALLNPNKQSLTVNLKKPAGVRLVKRLVAWADVVSENFAPGVMERLGLDYASLRALRDDLIMVSGCLFGQTGPQREYPGFGGQGAAIAGFNHLTGYPDSSAHGPYGTITDSLAPRYVALAIAAALHARRRTGKGQYIDVSQIECGVYSLSEMIVRRSAKGESLARCGNREAGVVPHAIYPCRAGDLPREHGSRQDRDADSDSSVDQPGGRRSDRWIAIAARSESQWVALLGVLKRGELAGDARFSDANRRSHHEAELDALLAQSTAEWDAYELMKRLQGVGVEAGVVQNHCDLLADPQLAHRGHFVNASHARLGELLLERSGFRIEGAMAGALDSAGPLLGEHNRLILRDVLGLHQDEVDALAADGVLS